RRVGLTVGTEPLGQLLFHPHHFAAKRLGRILPRGLGIFGKALRRGGKAAGLAVLAGLLLVLRRGFLRALLVLLSLGLESAVGIALGLAGFVRPLLLLLAVLPAVIAAVVFSALDPIEGALDTAARRIVDLAAASGRD